MPAPGSCDQDANHTRSLPGRVRARATERSDLLGRLLCIVYVLGGTDFHYQNIIASGQSPVLIDLETILQPRVEPRHGPAIAQAAATKFFWDSVLRTNLLPEWCVGPEGAASYDTGGLTGSGGQATPFSYFSWRNINSDQMSMVSGPVSTNHQSNHPASAIASVGGPVNGR